jgi:hypothetical protein
LPTVRADGNVDCLLSKKLILPNAAKVQFRPEMFAPFKPHAGAQANPHAWFNLGRNLVPIWPNRTRQKASVVFNSDDFTNASYGFRGVKVGCGFQAEFRMRWKAAKTDPYVALAYGAIKS